MARSRWIPSGTFAALLALCGRENAEALRLSMDYGLRIGDVLRMPSDVLVSGVWSFKEEKTGKRRRIRLSETHKIACRAFAGKYFVFEHRLDQHRHRTRQAVYKDIRRLSRALGYRDITPHSARKIYAVERLKTSGDINRVQHLLNHSDPAVTALYALSDRLANGERRRSKTPLS